MKRILILLALSSTATAGTLSWTWTNPTQYEDNSPLAVADITQTRVEWGSCSGTGAGFGVKAGEVILPGNGTAASKTGIAPGTYCARAYTTAKGKESDASNVAQSFIDQPTPQPPVLATVNTAAMIPVYDKRWGYWAMGDQVGTVKLGAECDASQSFGNGFYAIKNPADVSYYFGRRHRAVIAVQCGDSSSG